MSVNEILRELESLGSTEAVAGMKKYGINTEQAYGVSIPNIRKTAKKIGKDKISAEELWATGIHEAKLLAPMIMPPKEVTEELMERWVLDFDSWDVCDQCCNNLFRKTVFAHQKAVEWHARPEEFVRRTGYVLMACLAVHDKKASDEDFKAYLNIIKNAPDDERNFVKKAVNWALRQIGKRNQVLNAAAIETAELLKDRGTKSSTWIATNALRELTSAKVQKRLEISD